MVNSNQPISLSTVVLRSSALVGSKTVQDGMLFLLFVWLARTDQSGYGLIVLGMSVVSLLRSLQSLGLDQYTLRELSSSQNHPGPLLKQMALLKFLLAGIAILAFAAFAIAKQWPLYQIAVISILLSGQCFEGIADTFFNLFRAEGLSINESISRTGPNVIATLYGVVCLYLDLDILFFSLLFLLSGSLKLGTAIYGVKKLRRFSPTQSIHIKIARADIHTLLLFTGISFLGMFYNEIQIFWLKQFHTFIDIAVYRTAHDVTASVCGIFAQIIFGAVLFPQLSSIFTSNNPTEFNEFVRSYFLKVVAVGSGLSLFLSLFGGTFVLLIYGEQYRDAAPLVPLFGTAAFFSFINNFLINVILAMKEEKRLFLFHILPAFIGILIGALLISKIGPMGAALTLLISRVAFSILLIATLETKIHIFRLADYRKMVSHWLIAGVIFVVIVRFNFVLASSFAILTYALLLVSDLISSEKKIHR